MVLTKLAPAFFVLVGLCPAFAAAAEMPWVAVAKDKKTFTLEPSGKRFIPWGFNYDRDSGGGGTARGLCRGPLLC